MNQIAIAGVVCAILANALSNVFLKKAMQQATGSSTLQVVWQVLLSPWTWAGLFCAGVLLVSYLVAIRTAPLGSTYAAVTGMTVAVLTLWGIVSGAEAADPMRLLGTAFVFLGFLLITGALRV